MEGAGEGRKGRERRRKERGRGERGRKTKERGWMGKEKNEKEGVEGA